MEARQNYSERKVESVQDKQQVTPQLMVLMSITGLSVVVVQLYPCPGSLFQCILSVSFVDEDQLRLVRKSRNKSLQNVKPLSVLPRKVRPPYHRNLKLVY